ncbi:MAG: YtxH domain-containing protein [Chitinophagaceae bacterium]
MANSKVILGFIAGASLGAIAAILLAPEKGTELRKKIADKTVDLGLSLKENLMDYINGIVSSGTGVPEKVDNETPEHVPSMNLNTMG